MPTIGPSQGIGQVIYDVVAQAAASADGDWYTLPINSRKRGGKDEFTLQADITVGQADIQIEGRMSEDAQPVPMLDTVIDEVTTLTTAGLQAFAWVPQIRVSTTNVAATPTIRVEIFHG